MRETDLVKAALASTDLQEEHEYAPYDEFLKSDWENKCMFWERAGKRADTGKHGKALERAWTTNCTSPYALRWLGGTYARHPRDFPAAQG